MQRDLVGTTENPLHHLWNLISDFILVLSMKDENILFFLWTLNEFCYKFLWYCLSSFVQINLILPFTLKFLECRIWVWFTFEFPTKSISVLSHHVINICFVLQTSIHLKISVYNHFFKKSYLTSSPPKFTWPIYYIADTFLHIWSLYRHKIYTLSEISDALIKRS